MTLVGRCSPIFAEKSVLVMRFSGCTGCLGISWLWVVSMTTSVVAFGIGAQLLLAGIIVYLFIDSPSIDAYLNILHSVFFSSSIILLRLFIQHQKDDQSAITNSLIVNLKYSSIQSLNRHSKHHVQPSAARGVP
jgi:hypothetical protein